MKRLLTIAGSDCSGGAGVQADMRVAVQHGLYPMSVITALTAQTRGGVRNTLLTPPKFVAEQLDAVFSDHTPDVVKIGMLGDRKIVEVVAWKLLEHKAKNVVLDTVFMSSSGYELLTKDGIVALKEQLFPLCYVITPNIPEVEVLLETKINNKEDMEKFIVKLSTFCPNAIITGGHLSGDGCDDLLYENGKITWFTGEKINSSNTHGTGCAFSSALACNLAMGQNLEESVGKAKKYVVRQMKHV